MNACGKCDGRKVFNRRSCDACGGTSLQDGRISVPKDPPGQQGVMTKERKTALKDKSQQE